MPSIDRPTPPPAACALEHHAVDSHVGWQWWSVKEQKFLWLTGVVVAHVGDRRLLRIRLDGNGRVVTKPCGYIVAAPVGAR